MGDCRGDGAEEEKARWIRETYVVGIGGRGEDGGFGGWRDCIKWVL